MADLIKNMLSTAAGWNNPIGTVAHNLLERMGATRDDSANRAGTPVTHVEGALNAVNVRETASQEWNGVTGTFEQFAKVSDPNVQIPYPANDMERQGALALGDVRTTEAELQELRREVDSIVDDAWQEYHDIPDANGRYEQLGLLPEQQYALEEARLWEALQADLSAVSPKSLGTRETEAFLATAGRMVSDEFGRQVEADDAKLDLAEAEWYDQNPAEIEGRAWDEIYQQAEIDNTIFDRAKLDFEDQSRADAEPDYEAMCYEQWRNAKPDPAIDYAEAYADVAGDATLSWRLEEEDPIEILADVSSQARSQAGIETDRSEGKDDRDDEMEL